MASYIVTSYQLKKWGTALENARVAIPEPNDDSKPSTDNARLEARLALRDIEDTLRIQGETVYPSAPTLTR